MPASASTAGPITNSDAIGVMSETLSVTTSRTLSGALQPRLVAGSAKVFLTGRVPCGHKTGHARSSESLKHDHADARETDQAIVRRRVEAISDALSDHRPPSPPTTDGRSLPQSERCPPSALASARSDRAWRAALFMTIEEREPRACRGWPALRSSSRPAGREKLAALAASERGTRHDQTASSARRS